MSIPSFDIRKKQFTARSNTALRLAEWQPLPLTYGALSDYFCPELSPDNSKSNHAAKYSALHPSPFPPEFCYEEPAVYDDLLARWRTLIRGREEVELSPTTHLLWTGVQNSSARRSTAYHSEGWVNILLNTLVPVVSSMIQDLLNVADSWSVMSAHPKGDFSLLTVRIGDEPSLGTSVQNKTTRILDHYDKDFAVIHTFAGKEEKGARAILHKACVGFYSYR
ncbi:hypothetical protein B0H16DRAFT_674587 [Mycena metata]|uniref:Uncharacterized protein n=1 Tax=Mycena metata TaxID=1033252 RepID=A0AAD7J4G8_9AGAR|nr:hypothetical protein B0H16DRAFT_674587 [Mycena metata]